MGDATRELTHDLCQRGPAMRKLRAEHLSWMQDMTKLFGWITSWNVRSEAKGMMMVQLVMPPVQAPVEDNYVLLKNQQRRSSWRVHQIEAVTKQGRFSWDVSSLVGLKGDTL